MKKLLTLLCVFFLLGLSHTACADQSLTHVKIAQWGKEKIMLYLPLYVAAEEGYFARNGLYVEIVYTGNDDQTFAAVASKDVDFGFADPVFTAIAHEKGLEAKTVAMMVTSLGLSGYTNNPNLKPIEKPKDLAGLRVSSFPEPSTTYTLLKQLKMQTPGLDKMAITQMAMGAQLAALEAGKVDVALDFEPAVSKAEEKGYHVIFPVASLMDRQAITGLTVLQSTIDQKPQIVQKMVTSLQQAITAIYKDRAVAYRTAEKDFPDLSKAVIKHAVDRIVAYGTFPSSVVVDDVYWQRTLKTRLKSGELKKSQATTVAVDNRFAEKAKGQ